MSAGNTAGLVHLQTDGTVYRITTNGGQIISTYDCIQRHGKTLVLAHPKSSPITIPMPVSAEFAMVAPSCSGNTYTINQDTWDHYRTITIDNAGTRQAPVRVSLEPANHVNFWARNVDSDLVLFDPSNGKSLTIRGAFGGDRDLDGLFINVHSTNITVRDFQKAQTFLANHLGVNTIPDVTFSFAIYYLDFLTEMA